MELPEASRSFQKLPELPLRFLKRLPFPRPPATVHYSPHRQLLAPRSAHTVPLRELQSSFPEPIFRYFAASEKTMSQVREKVAGEMAQGLKAPGFDSQPPHGDSTIICNSSSRGSEPPLLASSAPGTQLVHRFTCRQNVHTLKIISF